MSALSTSPRHAASNATHILAAVLLSAALCGLTLLDPYAPLMAVAAIALGILIAVAFERPEYALVVLVGAAALDVSGRLAEVGGAKVTMYQGLATIVFGMTVWRLATGRVAFHRTPLDIPLLAFVCLVISSIPVATNPRVAFVQTASFLSSAFLFYAVVVLADDTGRLRALVLGTLAVAAAVGAFAVLERLHLFAFQEYLQIWQESIRSRVTFKDPNIMAAFEAGAFALALPVVLTVRDLRWRLLGFGGLALAVGGIVCSGSRGGLVGLVVAVIAALLFSAERRSAKLIIALALACALAATWVTNTGRIQSRVVGITSDPSAMDRVTMAISALNIAADHPLGVGFGNYALVYPFYRDASVRESLIESHTAYLTVLVETGVLGLLAFLAVLVAFAFAVFRFWRRSQDRTLRAIAAGSLAGFAALGAQAFTYSLESSKLWWLTMGVGVAASIVGSARATAGEPGSAEAVESEGRGE